VDVRKFNSANYNKIQPVFMAEEETNGGEHFVGERRDNSAILAAIAKLDKNLSERLTRLETQREDLIPRCDSHAKAIEKINERIDPLVTYQLVQKRVLKVLAYVLGTPAAAGIMVKLTKVMEHLTNK
jgi:hypothetical protein